MNAITGAMLTQLPKLPRDTPRSYANYLYKVRGVDVYRKPEPTAVMIHIEGKGPRRVYRNVLTDKCFVMVDGRRKYLTEKDHREALEAHLNL